MLFDKPRRVLIVVENLPVPLDRRVWRHENMPAIRYARRTNWMPMTFKHKKPCIDDGQLEAEHLL